MDDKKLLNGKFTFKSCVVQKKRASLLSENVNRQLAESKEVVGLPRRVIGRVPGGLLHFWAGREFYFLTFVTLVHLLLK